MEQSKTFPCPCGKGDVLRKISNSNNNPGKAYYACPAKCGYFRWEDGLRMCCCGQGYCNTYERNGGLLYICPILGKQNCGYKELVPKGAGSSSSSPGPSTPLVSYSGPAESLGKGSHGRDCSNCKLLSMQIKLLKAKLDVLMHPEDHPTSQSTAVLHELFDGLLVEDEFRMLVTSSWSSSGSITPTLRSSQSQSQSIGSSSGGRRSNAAAALFEKFEGIDLDGRKGEYDSDDCIHADPFEDDPTDSEARWSP